MSSRYWRWLFLGLNGDSGISKFFDRWIFFHLAIGLSLAALVSGSLTDISKTLMLPLASIFVGLSFAWSGNVQALLQSDEIEKMIKHHPDGLENYIYTFQTAILVILLSLIAWGIVGLHPTIGNTPINYVIKFMIKFLMYSLSSIALRECWQVISGGQLLLLMRHIIKERDKDS